MTEKLTKAQVTTLRRAAGLLYDLGENKLSYEIDRFVDRVVGRKEQE